jgi:hypothetical protein
MMSRVRSPAGAACYIRATANPGGKGHNWIKNRFIDGYTPGVLYRDRQSGLTRCFIPSLLQDNQKLLSMDPNYDLRLKMLPSHLEQALRYGNWDVFSGQVFDEFNRRSHVVKPFPLSSGAWFKFYSFDWGYAKPFSLGKWAVNADGRMIRYGEWYGCVKGEIDAGIKMGSKDLAHAAWNMATQEGVKEIVADPSIWNKHDNNESVAENFAQTGFRMLKANNDRINGWAVLHQRLKTIGNDGLPMLLFFDTCVDAIRTIPVMLPDPHNPEDIDTTLEDHALDDIRYAVMSRAARFPYTTLQKHNGQWNLHQKKEFNWFA